MLRLTSRTSLVVLLIALCGASCVQPKRGRLTTDGDYEMSPLGPDLQARQGVSQGMIGVSFYDQLARSGGANPAVAGTTDDLEVMPSAAVAWQEVYGDGRIDWGLEGGATVGYRTGNGEVDADGGGGVVNVDVDLALVDAFGGLFLSTHLGNRARLYGGAGPLIQFASYSQEGFDSVSMQDIDQSGTGVGIGMYARLGYEFIAGNDVIVGMGIRWVDSEVSIDDNLGRLNIGGFQVFLTISDGY